MGWKYELDLLSAWRHCCEQLLQLSDKCGEKNQRGCGLPLVSEHHTNIAGEPAGQQVLMRFPSILSKKQIGWCYKMREELTFESRKALSLSAIVVNA